VVASTDPLGNTVTAAHDYRVLAPSSHDANGNRNQVAFDVLGLVVASAVLGKIGDNDGDTLDDPTSTFEYDLFAWQTSGKPNWSRSRVRETHQNPDTRWLSSRSTSQAAAEVWVKAQARPGLAPARQNGQLVLDQASKPVLADTGNLRWIGNGRVVRTTRTTSSGIRAVLLKHARLRGRSRSSSGRASQSTTAIARPAHPLSAFPAAPSPESRSRRGSKQLGRQRHRARE
jgi:hypothetical protein